MRPNDPDRFDLEESFATVRKGLQHDSGLVRMRLVHWLEPRGGLRVLHGGGLINTARRVEQYADDCRRTWHDLDTAIARVTVLLAPSLTTA